MIKIIPSIYVFQGKIVGLYKAEFDTMKDYNLDPLEVAKRFEDHGIDTLHMVDLEGAKQGHPVNYGILETVAGYTDLKINFSGGISTDGDISKAYEYGASYITAASVAVNRRDLFASWIISYGRGKVALGADSLNQKISIKGWLKDTNIDVMEHIGYFYDRGLKFVKTTDIGRHDEMQGPSLELYKGLTKRFPGLSVLASGGVSSVDDIDALNELGVYGVIINKAFYEEKIKLKEIERFTQHYSNRE